MDNEGTVLDFLVRSRRNTKAVKKLMKSLLKKQKMRPSLIVTDKLRSYHAATYNHFDLQRHPINRSLFKKLRDGALSSWKAAALNV